MLWAVPSGYAWAALSGAQTVQSSVEMWAVGLAVLMVFVWDFPSAAPWAASSAALMVGEMVGPLVGASVVG